MKCVLLAGLFFLTACVPIETSGSSAPPTLTEFMRSPKGDIWTGKKFRQRHAKTSCFPPKLQRLISTLIDEIGPIEVTSGHRPRAGRSLHAKCLAVDFRPLMVSNATALAVMRKMPNIGGIGSYRRTDILHMDIGPRREWRL